MPIISICKNITNNVANIIKGAKGIWDFLLYFLGFFKRSIKEKAAAIHIDKSNIETP